MKLKSKQKLHRLPLSDLKAELNKAVEDVTEVKLKVASGKEKNIRLYKTKRQEVAVIKTIMRQKELTQSESIDRTKTKSLKALK